MTKGFGLKQRDTGIVGEAIYMFSTFEQLHLGETKTTKKF